MMTAVLVLLMVGLVSRTIACPDGTECQDKTTCCPTKTGYGCCQYPSAVCCPDMAHCCPQGYQCDLETQQCERKMLPWYRIPLSPQIPMEEEEKTAPAPLVKSGNHSVSVVHCDNRYVCPDGTTCCRTPSGQWTCCTYSVGQCCPDGFHCCPFGFHCDSTSTYCLRGTLRLPASPQIPAIQTNTNQIPAEEEEKTAPAPLVKSDSPSDSVIYCDSRNVCPESTTCCRTRSEQWTCCRYVVGQCCPDGIHCCPFGFQCDRTSTYCSRGTLRLPASPQIPAIQTNTNQIPAEEEEKTAPAPLVKSDSPSVSVIYCDSRNVCPESTTCCRTRSEQWTCCRYVVGQCCPDGIHCCPFGFQCDRTSTYCSRGTLRLPASPQIPAIQTNTNQIPAEEEEKTAPAPLVKSDSPSVSVIYCDSRYFCPDGTTCCRTPSGQWSCCTYVVGQCCPDGLHCCPFGFHCDRTSTYCLRGTLRLPASPQIPAIQSNTNQDQCCQSETGCCPIGFHCNEESKACVKDFDHSSPLKSALNLQNQASIIHCSDRFYCPAGHSCCKTLTSQWACCPYPLGQCCKDGKHCCEYGYDCNSTFTKCRRGYSSIPALLTKEALLL